MPPEEPPDMPPEEPPDALAEAQASGTAAIRAYTAQPRRKRVIRAGLVGEVASALESGQIKPWFQPQISTDTGAVSGAEALSGAARPTRGAGGTDDFAESVLPSRSAGSQNRRCCASNKRLRPRA